MKIPYTWLKQYCDPGLTAADLAERLALTGTEVERVTGFGASTANGNLGLLMVGEVVSVEAHPDADKLQVCKVNLGEALPRTIVCGAPNVAQGQKVAVALPGAELPGGLKIEPRALRGVVK